MMNIVVRRKLSSNSYGQFFARPCHHYHNNDSLCSYRSTAQRRRHRQRRQQTLNVHQSSITNNRWVSASKPTQAPAQSLFPPTLNNNFYHSSFQHQLKLTETTTTTRSFSATKETDDDNDDNDLKNLFDHGNIDSDDLHMIQLLRLYKKQYGDCHVPTGQSSSSRRERSQLASRMGIIMNDRDNDADAFSFDLKSLEDIAVWLEEQRQRYRNVVRSNKSKKCGIGNNSNEDTLKTIAILESMGVIWSTREAQWQRYYNRLCFLSSRHDGNEFATKDGSSYLKVDKHTDPALWKWSDQQRKLFHQGRLPKEREDLLRCVGFAFDLHEAHWFEQYEKLCKYKEEHDGDVMVPIDYKVDPSLGAWVSRQRHEHTEGTLPPHRANALAAIDFVWNPFQESWNRHYNELCKFFEEHGHTRVPRSAGRLFTWVCYQRRQLRLRSAKKAMIESGDDGKEDHTQFDNHLKADEAKKLSFLGIDGDDDDEGDGDGQENPEKRAEGLTEEEVRAKRLIDITLEPAVHDVNWIDNFKELCAFHAKFGHFSVPTSDDYTELSNWCRHQRYLFKANRLPKEREETLERIGFPWTAQAARWEKMYKELVQFHSKYGHSRVPVKKGELYRWTLQQRKTVSTLLAGFGHDEHGPHHMRQRKQQQQDGQSLHGRAGAATVSTQGKDALLHLREMLFDST